MQVRPSFLIVLVAFVCAGVSGSFADEAPFLMLDTGGHTGKVISLAFTQDGKYLVSAGNDKDVRVWDWEKRKTVRTFRGAAGPGAFGVIYYAALSHGDRWLAVSGAMAPGYGQSDKSDAGNIRLYNFQSGELKALLKGHTDVVGTLDFSPDGKLLLSGQGGDDGHAILWDVEKHAILRRTTGHPAAINALRFVSGVKKAVIATDDSKLALWSLEDGTLLKEMTGHKRKVSAIAGSPISGTIATGDEGGEIRFWDSNGNFLKIAGQECEGVGSLNFSPDEILLLATCRSAAAGQYTQLVLDVKTGRQVTIYPNEKHGHFVLASAYSPDGKVVATAGGDRFQIHVWDPLTGATKAVLQGSGRPVWGAGMSPDGSRIAWGHIRHGEYPFPGLGPLELALRLPLTGTSPEAAMLGKPEPVTGQQSWLRAQTEVGQWSLQPGVQNGGIPDITILNILEAGKAKNAITRGSENGYDHSAFTFSSDGQTIYSGGGLGVLAAYKLDGTKIVDFTGHLGSTWGLAVSPDGKYLVSSSDDETVRLWNAKTGELIVTLFDGADGEWVMWTPQGYYAGSPGADKIVGWLINKGLDKAPDYVTAEQLRKDLNRPDIVAKAIQLASAAEAVRTSYGTEFKLSDLLSRPAPRLRILSPAPDSRMEAAGSIAVKIALESTRDPVTRIRIQVNGRQLEDFLPDGPRFEPGELSFDVPLAKGMNTIVLTAQNKIGWSKVQDGTLTLTNESVGALDRRGTLYIIAIGVTQYPRIVNLCRPKLSCDLNFTSNDAIAFADEMEKRLGALHANVVRRVLVNEGKSDGAPTAANVVNTLGILGWANANDTVAVFLAGHGFNNGPNYRFASTDAAYSDGMIQPASIVPWYAIEEAIDSAKGRRLLFVDTCHSAGAYNERLGNAAYYANILAYSSARWDQEALESEEFSHGLFTMALIEGMAGAADLNHDGVVDTAELNEYLQKRVPELAKSYKHEQNPQFFKGRDAETYPLAAAH
jgi:WD40 repeat protein